MNYSDPIQLVQVGIDSKNLLTGRISVRSDIAPFLVIGLLYFVQGINTNPLVRKVVYSRYIGQVALLSSFPLSLFSLQDSNFITLIIESLIQLRSLK